MSAASAKVYLRETAGILTAFFSAQPFSIKAVLGKLPPEQRGNFREMVSGAFRQLLLLESILKASCDRPLRELEPFVKALLVLSVYRIYFLQDPDYTVVDEANGLCAHDGQKSFVNGVLRNVTRYRKPLEHFIYHGKDTDRHLSERFSVPRWIVEELRVSRGDYASILEGLNQPQKTFVRNGRYLRRTATVQDDLRQGAAVISPGGFLSVLHLGVGSGHDVLDMGCAPGAKFFLLQELDPRSLTGCDISVKRLGTMYAEAERLGLPRPHLICGDGMSPPFADESFDRLYLDVPCTASGTFTKHPEGKFLRTPQGLEELLVTQRALLARTFHLLRPGGVLCYATCSVFDRENDGVVAWFCAQESRARVLRPSVGLEDVDASCRHLLADSLEITPHGFFLNPAAHGLDGFYFSFIERQQP
ncbi:methyltransferase domain-containing protein [Desulfurispirillum indicum]|uniref:RsmB/NOP family class I SAM-dependent RNA methyltransferase n=1 Tax=Desulfurispirillum indicum TaxID=936456 RepID=UPI001CFA5A74|nr:transcription antitermination factor NusB [Desulfurispirillum indicum]UCZ57195.1 methyltransferase domain-containing protein [Desulfurispirillum indicum]